MAGCLCALSFVICAAVTLTFAGMLGNRKWGGGLCVHAIRRNKQQAKTVEETKATCREPDERKGARERRGRAMARGVSIIAPEGTGKQSHTKRDEEK